MAKPFLKWAGGKTQLLSAITNNLPQEFNSYIEPFAGSGAVMFDIVSNHPGLESVIINDINTALVNTYLNIKDHCEEMLPILAAMQDEYNNAPAETRDVIFYSLREEYNNRASSSVRMACTGSMLTICSMCHTENTNLPEYAMPRTFVRFH